MFSIEVDINKNALIRAFRGFLQVFIRELISNASDALEKRRYSRLMVDDETNIAYEIKITTDESARRLIIEDNGIGMDKNDLINCLGTIAKSGSF